jgi:hypothetical protein
MEDPAVEGMRRITEVAPARLALSLYSSAFAVHGIRMNDTTSFAVFLFPQAIDALGEVIKPYLTDAAAVGPHIVCSEVDSAGPLFTLTVQGHNAQGRAIEAELMMPHSFIKLVVSLHSEHDFGFGAREKAAT